MVRALFLNSPVHRDEILHCAISYCALMLWVTYLLFTLRNNTFHHEHMQHANTHPHTQTHTHTHTHTHTRMHARTHTHTHSHSGRYVGTWTYIDCMPVTDSYIGGQTGFVHWRCIHDASVVCRIYGVYYTLSLSLTVSMTLYWVLKILKCLFHLRNASNSVENCRDQCVPRI